MQLKPKAAAARNFLTLSSLDRRVRKALVRKIPGRFVFFAILIATISILMIGPKGALGDKAEYTTRRVVSMIAVLPTGLEISSNVFEGLARESFYRIPVGGRKRLQAWLKTHGHYAGPVDGIWGPQTSNGVREAMPDWMFASVGSINDFYDRRARTPNHSEPRAGNAHEDVDNLFMRTYRETPEIRQVGRPTAQAGSPSNARQELQNRIIQLRVACSLTSRGSIGERLVDQQLYMLTGERCMRPPETFQPIAPIQPSQPSAQTRCTQRLPPGNFRIPGMAYPLEFECR